jgi:hypothetical protein
LQDEKYVIQIENNLGFLLIKDPDIIEIKTIFDIFDALNDGALPASERSFIQQMRRKRNQWLGSANLRSLIRDESKSPAIGGEPTSE